MDIRVAVNLIDPTASIMEHVLGGVSHYKVSGVFANGVDSFDTAPWTTGLFTSQHAAWQGACKLLEARNSGRFN